MLPARLDELKRSAARSSALTALIRAKAWIPDLDSSDIGSGYPGIKRQIHAMTTAVFGKHPCFTFSTYHPIRSRFTDACNYAGTRISHLGSDVQKKLMAAYTLIEQLYTGAQRIICTTSHNKPPPL